MMRVKRMTPSENISVLYISYNTFEFYDEIQASCKHPIKQGRPKVYLNYVFVPASKSVAKSIVLHV